MPSRPPRVPAAAVAVTPDAERIWLVPLVHALRPRQWIKNGFVLLPVLFSGNFTVFADLVRALGATACFCVVSSAIYLVNDLADRSADRAHPHKQFRPIASGALSPAAAVAAAVILACLGFGAAIALDLGFAGVLAGYAALMVAYSFVLKHHVIVDVLAIAVGFVLRVVSGAVVIGVVASEWLLTCMGLLALLLAFGKRRSEALLLDGGGGNHRAVLTSYTREFCDAAVVVCAGATITSYAVYAATGRASEEHLIATLPFVVYGVFRYMWLVFHHGQGDNPTELAWTDRPLMAAVVAWAVTAAILLAY